MNLINEDFNNNLNLSYDNKKDNSMYLEEGISSKMLGEEDNPNPKSIWLDDLNNDVGLISIYPPEKENIEDKINEQNSSEDNTEESSTKNLEINQEKTLGRNTFYISKEDIEIEIDEENSPFLFNNNENLAIAITGETFEKIYSLHKKYIKDKKLNNNFFKYHKIFRIILKNVIIFARMAPEQKSLLAQSF